MPFLTPKISVTSYSDDEWVLDHPLIYQGKADTWTIPRGFATDFASVPRVGVWLIPRTGKWTKAAILHDYFCRVGIAAGQISAVDADGVFRRVMKELGVSPARRWLMWTGVRLSALTDPNRRANWWSTALPTLGISLLAAPVVVPPALLILLSLALFHIADVVTGGRKKISLKT